MDPVPLLRIVAFPPYLASLLLFSALIRANTDRNRWVLASFPFAVLLGLAASAIHDLHSTAGIFHPSPGGSSFMFPNIFPGLFQCKLFILWGNFWFGLLILPAIIKRTAPSRRFFLGIALVAVATSLAEGGTLCWAVHQHRHQRARENERMQALAREWAPFFAEEKTDLDPAKVEQLLTNRVLRSCLAEAVAWGGRAFHDRWADSVAEDLHVPTAQECQAYPGMAGGEERPHPALVNAFRFGRTWPELQQAAGWLWEPGRAWIRLAEDNPYLAGTPEMERWLAQSSMPVPSPDSARTASSDPAQAPSPHYTLRRRMAFDSVSGHAASEALIRYWSDQIIVKTPSQGSVFLPF